jgi:predicted MFS family arabinose efflux permease
MSTAPTTRRAATLAILVAALGYFVDIYDLILFSVVRKKSLLEIGVAPTALLDTGLYLLNMQMIGMLVGGLVWGILGDKRGRLSVLFGSILLYSLANIANGFVHDVPTYAVLRLIAGFGLAGELGAGITLVSESMHKDMRGYGTTIVASIGICGAVVAALVGKWLSFRTAYFVGGGLGLSLLLLRVGVYESGMFEQTKKAVVSRGNFLKLFSTLSRARRYVSVILVGVPIWYVVGILVTTAPELGADMGLSPAPDAGMAVLISYSGLAIGDVASGALSQVLKSRKRALAVFLGLGVAAVTTYFTLGATSLTGFYIGCGCIGLASGYWAVFVTIASEQFGTNVRATATTTAPNFVRGAVVPLTSLYAYLHKAHGLTLMKSAIVVGVIAGSLALAALFGLDETFGKDLDFVED